MAIIKMDDKKNLTVIDLPLIFCKECYVDTITVEAPHYYEEYDLSGAEMRICFALGGAGEYAVLTPRLTEQDVLQASYCVDSALCNQAGMYAVWLEFWGKGEDLHRLLYSSIGSFTVLPHCNADAVLGHRELTYFEQQRAKMEEYKAQISQKVAQTEDLCSRMQKNMQTMEVIVGYCDRQYEQIKEEVQSLGKQDKIAFYVGLDADQLRQSGNLPTMYENQCLTEYATWGKVLEDQAALQRLKAYISVYREDPDTPLYLDRTCQDAGRIRYVAAKDELPAGWKIWFEGANISLFVSEPANELDLPTVRITAGNLLCPQASVVIWDNCIRGKIHLRSCLYEISDHPNSTSNNPMQISYEGFPYYFNSIMETAHAAGKRISSISVYYPLGERTKVLYIPYDSRNRVGITAISPVGIPSVSIHQGPFTPCAMYISPTAFGDEYWYVQTPDGDVYLEYLVELK